MTQEFKRPNLVLDADMMMHWFYKLYGSRNIGTLCVAYSRISSQLGIHDSEISRRITHTCWHERFNIDIQNSLHTPISAIALIHGIICQLDILHGLSGTLT